LLFFFSFLMALSADGGRCHVRPAGGGDGAAAHWQERAGLG
jgi:hypothetical protein